MRPDNVPVEGYYHETSQLTEYFLSIRTLQNLNQDRLPTVADLPEFQRLTQVLASPLFGILVPSERLLPLIKDPLTIALEKTFPDWTVPNLTASAHAIAREGQDISLVGLGAWMKNEVILAALRESIVLYAGFFLGAAKHPPKPRYIWHVDKELVERANLFIITFNRLMKEKIPRADPQNAQAYWEAGDQNFIIGRCVRLGGDDSVSPTRYYHWAIRRSHGNALMVHDFWHHEVWTTERYQSALMSGRGIQ
ncbi:MAG: hypothetical protein EHM72_11805 [Calditrichaeota bacterium]|nr:MAG: hypothetical protein EHM72_11805 [Calditrichota bacterium]